MTATNPMDATMPIIISLGLGKQITDTLSADLVVRQCSGAGTEGVLGALTTQMSLVYKFK